MERGWEEEKQQQQQKNERGYALYPLVQSTIGSNIQDEAVPIPGDRNSSHVSRCWKLHSEFTFFFH